MILDDIKTVFLFENYPCFCKGGIETKDSWDLIPTKIQPNQRFVKSVTICNMN